MKMPKLVLLASLLALVAMALPLAAATADFQGNCASGIPTNCVFDATKTSSTGPGTSCAPSTISIYFWDFDNTTTTDDLWTTSSFVSHTYTGAYCDVVRMTVFCANGTSDTRTIGLCNTFGVGGWIRPGAGWLP